MPNNEGIKLFVTELLEKNIPAAYTYHNLAHTLYVAEKVVEIGKEENCDAHELELLHTAALLHDSGFINIYKGHEEESCRFAKNYLPHYGFFIADIEKICGMIMATKYPQQPKTKLEEIVADADLEYLGTAHAKTFAGNLFTELKNLNKIDTAEDWKRTQTQFLKQHHYFTSYCKTYKEPIKQQYLKTLIT